MLLLAVCLLPYLVEMSGLLYLAGSLVLNLQFLRHAWRLKFAAMRADTAIRTFRFSITHLMLLFLLLVRPLPEVRAGHRGLSAAARCGG